MRVVTQDGTIELGVVEAAPTIGITDYSRRVTDDFGVTTVVKRGFARRMSVRLAVPFEEVDAIQRQLAALRATPARWIADDAIASLSIIGLYKDFEVDHAVPPISYCTLTVEGIVEDDAFVDSGIDPAPGARTSSLQLLQPIAVTDAVLIASSVSEDDAGEWAAGTSYAAGARVIKAATHRLYESLAAGNTGNDPVGTSGKWLDVGPTGRWAMFDQALGSVTTSTSAIVLTLRPTAAVTGLAVLDTNAATVRVRAPNYDRTQVVTEGAGSALFLDLAVAAGASVTVTLTPAAVTATPRPWDDGARWSDYASWRDTLGAGDGTVSVGTLLIGSLTGLGVTEASPTSGITDYSRKVVDDFGEVSIVPRAWAKKMAAKALIRTDAVDQVAGRIAAARALPSLWLGDAGLDSLTVYGFFRDFSIEIGTSVSKLSLSIEGLSTAGKVTPIGGGTVDWPNVGDPNGTKPTDNADKTSDNTSKDTAAVGGRPSDAIVAALDTAKARQDALETVKIPAIESAAQQASARIDAAHDRADAAFVEIEGRATEINQRIDSISLGSGYDDTSIRASIDSVDKAAIGRDAGLAESIRSVTASLDTADTNLRALVQTKEDAAVGREGAIAQRVEELIAQGGGGSEGVDTVARAEIARVDRAYVAGDVALAGRAATLEASARAPSGRMLNANPTFFDLTAGDGSAGSQQASGWSYWWDAPDGSARLPGAVGPWAWSLRASADHVCGLSGQRFAADPGWYVLDVAFEILDGSFSGAGIFLSLADASGAEIGFPRASLTQLYNDPDQYAAGTPFRLIRRTKLMKLEGAFRSIALVAPMNWAGFGEPLAFKALNWLHLGIRPASDAEIRAQKAISDTIPAVAARVKTTEDTLADLPNRYAAASRTTTLEAQLARTAGSAMNDAVNYVNGRVDTTNTQLTARIEERATAIADAKVGVVAQTVTTLEGRYNGTAYTVSQQAGVIVDLQGKASAYVKVVTDAGNGRAGLSLWSDQFGGRWALLGDGLISGGVVVDGNVISTGSIDARQIKVNGVDVFSLDRTTMTSASSAQSGALTSATAALTYATGFVGSLRVRPAGTLFAVVDAYSAATDSSDQVVYNSFDLFNSAGQLVASTALPYGGFTGRLTNYLIRIPNTYGDDTLTWRIGTRRNANTAQYSSFGQGTVTVNWTAL